MKKLLVLFGLIFAIFACSNDCLNVANECLNGRYSEKNNNENNQGNSNTEDSEKRPTTLQDVVDNANAGDEIDLSNYELASYTATINKKLTIKNGSLSGANLTVTSENVKLEQLTDLSVTSSSRLTINDSKLSNLLIGGNGETSRSRTSEAQTSLAMVSLTDSEIENVELNGFNSQLNITDTATKIDDIITSTKSMIILEAGKYDGMKDPVVTDNGELTRIDMTKDKTLSILSIYSNPKKAEYKLNEEIDLTGLIVMGTYTASVEIFKSGGWKGEARESVTKWEDEEDYDVGYDFSKTGVRIVTIKSTINPDVACNFYVYVVDDSQNGETSKPEKIEFTNIRVESLLPTPKTSYKVGEKLDLSGYRVMGTYNGLDVNLQYTSDPANGTVLEKDVVVKFYYANQEIDERISIKVTQPYTVKFYDRIDSSKPLYTTEAVDGELLKLPSEPNRENYIFDGWYIGDEEVTSKYIVKSNLELTAKWKASNYTITYILNGGTNVSNNPEGYDVETKIIKLENATKAGYTFGGWYTDKACTETNKVTEITKGSTGNITLYAQWTANTYTVQFNANVSDNSVTGTMTDQTFTYDEEKALTANAFTRDGYTFAGWATSASGGVTYTDEQEVSNLIATANGEVILYAVWTENGTVLPVTFEPPSGSEIDCGDVITLSCATEGATIYYMTGIVEREYTAPIKITDNVKIVAYATKDGMSKSKDSSADYTVKTYTVTYKSDYGTVPSDVAGLKKGDKLTAEQLPVLTTDGYTFAGWYNGETKIEAGLTITRDLTLTAQWTANTYTVKFDANVSDNSVTDTMANQTFTYDVAKELTANTFTRTGYTFAGWNTEANGKGTSYADKASVSNLTATANGEVTLYAQWAEAEANAYYVSNIGSDDYAGTVYKPFATMQKAVNTAITSNDGETTYTIYVMSDITGGEGLDFMNDNYALININPTEKLNLKISGYNNTVRTIDAIEGGCLMYIGANAVVTLENITLTNGYMDSEQYSGGVCIDGGTLNMNSGATISNCTALKGGGVYLLKGTFNMSGGSIENCKANNTLDDYGGGVYMENGTFNMSGGTIGGTEENAGCTAEKGGGVYVADGEFKMSGSAEIKGCKTYSLGGGVYMNAGTFEMSGSAEISGCEAVITGNSSASYGGGVYQNGGTFTMSGGTISGCKVYNSTTKTDVKSYGGGVYQNTGTFNMSGGTISECTAEKGGGVYQNAGTFTMSDGSITGNIATSSSQSALGGGVYVGKEFEMQGGSISENKVSSSCNSGIALGGGVYVGASASVEMSDGSITGNNVTYTGTNSYISGGCGVGVDVSLSNATISGGGIFNLNGGKIQNNDSENTTTTTNTKVYGKDVLVRGSENSTSGPYFNKTGGTVGSDVVYRITEN